MILSKIESSKVQYDHAKINVDYCLSLQENIWHYDSLISHYSIELEVEKNTALCLNVEDALEEYLSNLCNEESVSSKNKKLNKAKSISKTFKKFDKTKATRNHIGKVEKEWAIFINDFNEILSSLIENISNKTINNILEKQIKIIQEKLNYKDSFFLPEENEEIIL